MTQMQEISAQQFADLLTTDLTASQTLELPQVRLVVTQKADGTPGPILVDASGTYAQIVH